MAKRNKGWEMGVQYDEGGPIRSEFTMSEAAYTSHIWSGGTWTHQRMNQNSSWEKIDA